MENEDLGQISKNKVGAEADFNRLCWRQMIGSRQGELKITGFVSFCRSCMMGGFILFGYVILRSLPRVRVRVPSEMPPILPG